ncbi:bifunctional proline dehydrogenase/L-glutamate gamma-semialdehyde dehydrogenase PutA [soil metagenome]
MIFNKPLPALNPLRAAIAAAYRMEETRCVENLLSHAALSQNSLQRVEETARKLVAGVRETRLGKGGLDSFMYQYDLSSEEGITLMCMAEALLRIPDSATVDRLIRDKIVAAQWEAHLGKSESLFVNATTWGLMLTGKLMSRKEVDAKGLSGILKRLIERSSEPVIRQAITRAMRILGKQFVMGQTISEALKRARENERQGYRYSYDMLGEAARTAKDAERYFQAYCDAIKAIGQAAAGRGPIAGPGISVKLSALYPRYEFAQHDRALAAVVPKLRALAIQAKEFNICLTVDAEEADRLDLSLDIIEAVFIDPALSGWEGFGLALQSYQKRAWATIDWLADLAKRQHRRLMIRLIKGAYWDSEIKNSQERGLEGYPVFTRKASTDVSFLACAKKLLAFPDAFYPMFATHNAHTLAAVLEMAGDRKDYEFQCLHGMGEALYEQVVGPKNLDRPCRVYAPVGSHEDLLPYLVRRLLENGANSSFVNRIVDANSPIEELIADPVAKVAQLKYIPHPRIALPEDLFGAERKNSRGLDLTNMLHLQQLSAAIEKFTDTTWIAKPSGDLKGSEEVHVVRDPSDTRKQLGEVHNATAEELAIALERAHAVADSWAMTPADTRAACLERAADLFEANQAELLALLVREAGKALPDALSEIREAVDYCRYYAVQARKSFSKPLPLPGPTGELNQLSFHGRGPIVCISPWNFPLAIFAGQVTAALVAGNPVLAKPAQQTPLIAAVAVRILHEAGIPKDVLQLIPARGSLVGERLLADPRVKGVVLTGSTATAFTINGILAKRPGAIVPLIAETGGQNTLIVDSSALLEQVVMDVIASAFNSAGQRCSACRVLYVQEDVAPKLIEMLQGAMAELVIGNPQFLSTDIGPVIDDASRNNLQRHAERMEKEATLICQLPLSAEMAAQGSFFAPRVFELKSLSQLTEEVFGPILHIIRYKAKDLDAVIQSINDTGFGLTLGVQSRIDTTIRYIQQRVKVGNMYVNRNMIGAVVGVQPFGGEGLSGTGPKAGGPHYLHRLCVERTLCVNTTAAGGNTTLMCLQEDEDI